AGALGSTYLLLRDREQFPAIEGKALGSRFSTNGDLLTFAFHCQNREARPPVSRLMDPTRGPVITSSMTFADELDGGAPGQRGFLVQDAGYADFLSWLVEVANASRVSRTLRWIGRRLDGWVTGEPETEISGTLTDLLGPCDLSSGSMPLLAMGRDVANGRIFLKPDRKGRQKYLDVDWKMQQSGPHFKRVRDTCDEIATRLGGRFGQNPGTRYF